MKFAFQHIFSWPGLWKSQWSWFSFPPCCPRNGFHIIGFTEGRHSFLSKDPTYLKLSITLYNFNPFKQFRTAYGLENTYGMQLLFFKKVDSITCRTVTLDQATDSAKLIGTAALNMFHTMKLSIADMRGVSRENPEHVSRDEARHSWRARGE